MIIVVLWVLLTLVFGFWTAARASAKGYSFGKFLFLGLLFGIFAWLATYSLPAKVSGETLGQAGGRAVTTGFLNVAEGVRDAGRTRSPGIARGVGAVATRAAMNAAGGARDAVAERRVPRVEGDASDTENAADHVGETTTEEGGTGASDCTSEAELRATAASSQNGLAAGLAKRATRTALTVAESARAAAAEHRAASTGPQVMPQSNGESVEDRLSRLESLREQGLLTEDEYRGRRDLIIAEL